MKLISHRGNLWQRDTEKENKVTAIDKAIHEGFDVEIDIRIHDGLLYLGHDNPQEKIDAEFLYKRRRNLWIHCKEWKSLCFMRGEFMHEKEVPNYFWHQEDDYTITSHGIIWVYPGKEVFPGSVQMMGEFDFNLYEMKSFKEKVNKTAYGVCSDNVAMVREFAK